MYWLAFSLFLNMETQKIWNCFNDEIYFFILKKVKNKNAANDIFQNSFLKIHRNLHQVKEEEKIKAWVFQIARNEITNYFNQETKFKDISDPKLESNPLDYQHICCFDKFINNLPDTYKEVIEMVYIVGKKQTETAAELNISLANVKARIRRGKAILKKNFNECCKYEFDKQGNLVGEPNCASCTNS